MDFWLSLTACGLGVVLIVTWRKSKRKRGTKRRYTDSYVYALLSPVTGQIRYVGKSNVPRLRFEQHIESADAGSTRPVCRWIAQLKKHNMLPNMVVMYHGPRSNILEQEKRFIQEAAVQQKELLLNIVHNEKQEKNWWVL